jgi:hypothetical protein
MVARLDTGISLITLSWDFKNKPGRTTERKDSYGDLAVIGGIYARKILEWNLEVSSDSKAARLGQTNECAQLKELKVIRQS